MCDFSNVYSELFFCLFVGAVSGFVRLRHERMPVNEYNVISYILVGMLSTLMGIGLVSHFTTKIEPLLGTAVVCGQLGERSFELVFNWIKNKICSNRDEP